MTASIIMTVCNGERYLARQLESVRLQTREPMEVLIFDDASSDRSAELAEEFIALRGLRGWRVFRNGTNLGWKANYIQALGHARGDVVFLCDQDDIWRPDKVEVMMKQMEERPSVLVLACSMKILYEQGAIRSKHEKQLARRETDEPELRPFQKRFFYCPRPGCAFAIRRDFIARVIPYWQNDFPHDEFLWITAQLEDGAWFCQRELMTFRRHDGNASDIRYKDIRMQKQQLDYIARSLRCFQRMDSDGALTIAGDKRRILRGAVTWCAGRQRLMETRNPFRWLPLLLRHRYYNSAMNCLSDLYLVLFGSFHR